MVNFKTLLFVLIPLLLVSFGSFYAYKNILFVPWSEPSGEFGIGIIQWTFHQYDREEVLAPADNYGSRCNLPGAWRSIPVSLNYPIDKAEKKKYSRDYLEPGPVIDEQPIPNFMKPLFKLMKKYAVSGDPEIAQIKDKYPVIVFSPGLGATTYLYTQIIEEIVSHGYIVLTANYPYISGNPYIQENDCALPDFPIPYTDMDKMQDLMNRAIVEHKLDLKYIVEQLRNINDSSGFLKGKLDLENLVFAGHSMGGIASTIHCNDKENYCKAAINLDGGGSKEPKPAVVGPEGSWPQTNRDLKYLKFMCRMNQELDPVPPIEKWGDDQYKIWLTDTNHSTYQDMVFLPGMGHEIVDPYVSHEIITTNILNFLDYVIKGDELKWFSKDNIATVVDKADYPDGFIPQDNEKNQLSSQPTFLQ